MIRPGKYMKEIIGAYLSEQIMDAKLKNEFTKYIMPVEQIPNLNNLKLKKIMNELPTELNVSHEYDNTYIIYTSFIDVNNYTMLKITLYEKLYVEVKSCFTDFEGTAAVDTAMLKTLDLMRNIHRKFNA